jgi:capsular exopolysaccharide synthesis family protein
MSKTYEALKRAEALRAREREEAGVAGPSPLPSAQDVPLSGSDDYYELRRRLESNSVGDSLRTVLVASALHGEGASSVSCLLARAMADGGRAKSLLVDMNLRTPSLWRLMDVQGRDGITSVINDDRKIEDVMQETGVDGLKVVTAGDGYVDAINVIDNARTLEVIGDLGRQADVVFIDAAPITLYPDARALAPVVDAVILVVEADITPVSVASRAVDLIRDSGANLLTVVLNKRNEYVPDRVMQLVG